LGVFLDAQAVKPALAATGASIAEINASRLLADPRLAGRWVGPIRDRQGMIVSFWARHPKDQAPLYLFLDRHWRQYVPAIGLDRALEAGDDLLLVEDPLEALLFEAHGLPQVAALGGPLRELNARRWRNLFDLGIATITLLVDLPDAHLDVLAILSHAERAGCLDSVYVIALRRVRAGLADDRSGLPQRPAVIQERILAERIPGRRYRLQSIQLPVQYVGWETPDLPLPSAPDVEPPIEVEPPRTPPALSRNGDHACRLHNCEETDCFCFD
jgi:hypothetical protein